MKKYLFLAAVSLVTISVAFIGCKSDKSAQQTDPNAPTDYELSITNQDTAQVITLVDTFFDYLEKGELTEAVAMLYADNSVDHFEEPLPLDNNQVTRMMSIYRSLPIQGHRIDYIKFHETYENEVKVTAIIEPATEDQAEVATVFYFRPFDYLGNWRLCLMDTHNGNQRIINNDQADSLEQKFDQDIEQKAK